MNTTRPVILIEDLEYTYPNGTKALNKINVSIKKKEIIGIMGKNGAGKTTLIRTFNGLIRPTKGNVYINGENIKNKSIGTLAQSVGIIFQNPQHQVFSNTIEEEIRFSLKSLNYTKKQAQEKINEILNIFNLEKYRERSPLNLSGGETKKLAVASIICRNPEILVFDEPTLGQDAKEIEFFINLIKDQVSMGKTIIIITHNVEFAMEYIPRTILMVNGQIIADGPTDKILTNGFLIQKSALILPQVFQFNLALNKIGIPCPEDVYSKEGMIQFLNNFLQKKLNEQIGDQT
jgi:energy-coupling factor transport system ATP-binding protein